MGNRTRLTGTYGEITNYDYDELDRLTKVRYLGGKSTTYSYDPNGNRTQMAYPFGNVTYRYDIDSNQLLSAQLGSQSRVEYVYDQNGSLSREKQLFGKEVVREIAYNYDPEARLIEIVLEANTNQPARVTNTYDDRGLRVVKNNGEESTIYITNLDNQVLYELDGTGKPKNTYFFANGEKVAQLDSAGKMLYLHNDVLGSPGIITNEAGEVVQRYTYEPFGSIIASEGITGNSYTFTGKEYDEEAGLYYYGARYYNPKLGRFITQDGYTGLPDDERLLFGVEEDQYYRILAEGMESSSSQNRFIYVTNNPLRFVDPDGNSLRDPMMWFMKASAFVTARLYVSSMWAGQKAMEIALKAQKYGGRIIEALASTKNGVTVVVDELSEVGNTVYVSLNAAGKIQYVGITNDIVRRSLEHAGRFSINAVKGLTNLTRADARAVEQTLIEHFGLGKNGGTLLNKINSIAQTAPNYAQQLMRGMQLLKQAGFPGF